MSDKFTPPHGLVAQGANSAPDDNQLAYTALLASYLARDWEAVTTVGAQSFISRLNTAEAFQALSMIGTSHIKLGRHAMGHELYRACLDSFFSTDALKSDLGSDVIDALIVAAIGTEDTPTLGRLFDLYRPGPSGRIWSMGVSPCRAISDWCEVHGVQKETLDPERIVRLPPAEYSAAECWMARLPGATYVAGWDFPLASTGDVLTGSNYLPLNMVMATCPHYHVPALDRIAHVWPKECLDVDEDALFLSAPEGMHFGHWLVDFLPRLRAWKRPMKIAIPDSLPPKNRHTLAAFGVRQRDLVECKYGSRTRFRSMTVVVTGDHQVPQPENLSFVYAGLADQSQTAEKRRRLFVNRGVGTRQVANREAFDSVLKKHGVTEVNLANISISDQRTLLAQTEIVVGVYGSDLYCMYMMPKGATVLELVSEAINHPVFARYGAILGMNHQFIRSSNAARTMRKVYKKDSDIDVDCDDLDHRLNEVIKRGMKSLDQEM